MATPHPLDNPIWSALQTEHTRFALANGQAVRYVPEIGPLSAPCQPSPAGYDALRALAAPSEPLVVFLMSPASAQPGWSLLRAEPLDQMILEQIRPPLPPQLDPSLTLRRLTSTDVPAMRELAALTEPGPFRERTIELGCFWGIFDGETLLAMTGQRLCLPQFVEVSAVCTHPSVRGRGFARVLVDVATQAILCRGRTPFLHVLPGNEGAIRVYRSLGFVLRRDLHLGVYRKES